MRILASSLLWAATLPAAAVFHLPDWSNAEISYQNPTATATYPGLPGAQFIDANGNTGVRLSGDFVLNIDPGIPSPFRHAVRVTLVAGGAASGTWQGGPLPVLWDFSLHLTGTGFLQPTAELIYMVCGVGGDCYEVMEGPELYDPFTVYRPQTASAAGSSFIQGIPAGLELRDWMILSAVSLTGTSTGDQFTWTVPPHSIDLLQPPVAAPEPATGFAVALAASLTAAGRAYARRRRRPSPAPGV